MDLQPPVNSLVDVHTTADATTYRWRAASRHPLQWLSAVFGGFIVFAAVFMPIPIVMGFDTDAQPPLSGALAFSAVLISGGSALLFFGLKRRGHESLRLTSSSMEYDTGPTALPLPLMLWFWPMLLGGPLVFGGAHMATLHFTRKVFQFDKATLSEFVLERVGERQRLRVDLGADRIEIGTLLREPEREWLGQQLQAWHAATQSEGGVK